MADQASGSNVAEHLKVALVCLSNVNRSMTAHELFKRNGYRDNVRSFGTGSQVKMPGESKDTPNLYPFGVTYESIGADLTPKSVLRRSEIRWRKWKWPNGSIRNPNGNLYLRIL